MNQVLNNSKMWRKEVRELFKDKRRHYRQSQVSMWTNGQSKRVKIKGSRISKVHHQGFQSLRLAPQNQKGYDGMTDS